MRYTVVRVKDEITSSFFFLNGSLVWATWHVSSFTIPRLLGL